MQHPSGAELHNVQSATPTPDGRALRLSRIPEATRTQLNGGAQLMALQTTGSEIRFNLVGPSARIRLRRPSIPGVMGAKLVEIYFGTFPASSVAQTPISLAPGINEITVNLPPDGYALWELAHSHQLPFDPELVRVILPYDLETEIVSIEGDILPPRPEQTPKRRYLAYGSSITHGYYATRPTETYAMQTAQILDADLINLGFSGSAQLEPAIADHIAGRDDWDFATLELGINVLAIWNEDQFDRAAREFLPRIANRNPDRPIFCIDLFTCDRDLKPASKAQDFRYVLRHAITSMALPNVHHISGIEMLTAAGLTVDLVHPSSHGMATMATRLAARIESRIKPREKVGYNLPRAEQK